MRKHEEFNVLFVSVSVISRIIIPFLSGLASNIRVASNWSWSWNQITWSYIPHISFALRRLILYLEELDLFTPKRFHCYDL